MIICIIAGGSGTRLWPLSQPNYPKHLLRLTGKTSMLQNTFARAKGLTDDIYIITEASHAAEVREQLPDLEVSHVLVEPGRRGTASCIALALAIISRDQPDETVVFLHADHHIIDTEGFGTTVRAAAQSSELDSRIALIGLEPTHAATGFGYIKSGREVRNVDGISVRTAERFVEKPSFEVAEGYLAEGNYLWNLGLFAAPVAVFVRAMRRHAPDLFAGFERLRQSETEEDLASAYLDLANQAIDYALMEKIDDLLVVPGRFDWADIGSYFDLHKILQGVDSNALSGDIYQIDCSDSMIHGSGKPIVAIGLSGIVVVDTPDGLLVCAKDQSQLVGDMVKQLQAKKAA